MYIRLDVYAIRLNYTTDVDKTAFIGDRTFLQNLFLLESSFYYIINIKNRCVPVLNSGHPFIRTKEATNSATARHYLTPFFLQRLDCSDSLLGLLSIGNQSPHGVFSHSYIAASLGMAAMNAPQLHSNDKLNSYCLEERDNKQ